MVGSGLTIRSIMWSVVITLIALFIINRVSFLKNIVG